tara:strand:- start:45 stop:791 length:747 start_codon:yes stop_codon:yes gene_type:complete
MKDIKYIKDYYNKYYTNELDFYWDKTKILNAFKTYENDYRQGKWLSKRMGIKGNETILDAGCGVGGVMKQISLLHSKTDIYGINVSDGQIKMAEQVLEGLNNCNLSVQDFMNTNYKDNTFDIVYFCESICHNNFEKVIAESRRILKPNGTLYIKDLVTKCSTDKLSESELIKLNNFIKSWCYEVFDIETIINKIDNIGGFELINNKRFIKPSIHWINAVRNSSLKEYHNARTSAIPPIRGADFLYKKI